MCDQSAIEYNEEDLLGVDENPVRIRVVVEVTDTYFDTMQDTRQMILRALQNDFDAVHVDSIREV